MITILIDNKEIQTEKGANLLDVCLENGIYIPNLCHIKGVEEPAASCRLCFVEIEGVEKPVPSCTVKADLNMVVKTDTKRVRQLQKTGFKLIMSTHEIDCKHCQGNKKCELQRIAKFLKVGLKPGLFELNLKEIKIDSSHPYIDYYPNRCFLCGKCIHACKTEKGRSVISFAGRGLNTMINFYNRGSLLPCEDCSLPCAKICPALVLRSLQ